MIEKYPKNSPCRKRNKNYLCNQFIEKEIFLI